MATATRHITADEFARMDFPEGAELVRGKVIEMTNPDPVHGQVCMNIAELLSEWSPRRSKGRILTNDSGVQTASDPDTVRGPDVMFLFNDRLPPGGLTHRSLRVPPDLAVEVFSPSDRWAKVREKVDDYFSAGVREVWVAWPRRRIVRVFRPGVAPADLADDAALTTPVLPGFRCTVGEVFAGV